jgi:hypothetical protein
MKLKQLHEAKYYRQSPIIDIIKDKIDIDKDEYWDSHGFTTKVEDLSSAVEELTNFFGEAPKSSKATKTLRWFINNTDIHTNRRWRTRISIWYDLVSSQYLLTIRHHIAA